MSAEEIKAVQPNYEYKRPVRGYKRFNDEEPQPWTMDDTVKNVLQHLAIACIQQDDSFGVEAVAKLMRVWENAHIPKFK